MNFLKNRRFQIESLEERTLLTAAPWSTGDETDYSGLVVTTLEDVVDASDHMTSIREAIQYAESLGASAEVTFAEGLSGKITLTGGALRINSAYGLSIDGDNRIAFDAGGEDRGFEILSGPVTLANLEVTGGFHTRQGGAIASNGDLTLSGVTVTDSYSGKYGSAVYIAPGTHLTVSDSAFVNNVSHTHGGGIYVEKTATADISGSRFEGNSTGSYGAAVYIWNDAVVNVTDTFFINNSAPNGTLRNYGGRLTMTNVVLTGNDQGFSSSDGGTNVGINVTLTGNTRSAVRGEQGATFTFYNSVILGGNKTFDLRTGATVGGDVNLSTTAFGTNFVMYNGGALFAADGYTPVGENQVMNAGSAAYNQTALDAAGNNRYYDGAIDLGAVEQIVTVTAVPATFSGEPLVPFEFDGPVDSVLYSLDGETWTEESPIRDAGTYDVWVKTLTAAGDEEIYRTTVVVDPLQLTVTGSTVADKDQDGTTDAEIIVGDAAPLYDDVTVVAVGQFASAEPGTWDVAVTYTVVGEKASNYVAPAPETLRGTIVKVEPQSLVVTTLDDVVDRHDEQTSLREAIAYAETFDVPVAVTFADGLEGVIELADGPVQIDSASQITVDGGNRITVDAGGNARGFEIVSGAVILTNISIANGYHEREGGAIANSGELTMINVVVSDSYSGKQGSAVYTAPGTSLTVVDSVFANNVSKTHGGGIFVEKGAAADISGSRFEGNATGSYGAAVYIWNDAVVNVTDTFFINNVAPNGTLRNYGGRLTMTNVVLTGNDQGFSSSDGGVNVGINVTITGNTRSAVRGEQGATFTFYNSVILGGNKTFDLRTGATAGGDVNLSTTAFGTNFVMYNGGALFAADGYTPVGENQVMNAGSAAYNQTEFDAVGTNRYYGGAIDIGAVEQTVTITEKPVVFNGEPQVPFEFDGPVDSVLYSLDGETWTEESPIRDAGTYDVLVKVITGGEEEIHRVTAEITPLQLTVTGSTVVDKDADGTTDAEIIVGDVATLYDDVTVVATGQFASAEPGTWDVTVTYTVVGENASNYIAPAPETLRGTIVYVEPKSLVVTTLDDVVDRYDGQTSLREAIAYAETFDVPVAVTFADGLEGVIELADGAVALGAENSITVDGGGAITIDAGGASRALEVGAAGAVLSDLTLTGGYADKQGGAIASNGDLYLFNVTVTDSFSGKFGGAVYVAPEASLTVVDSTFTGNTASSHGGAIFVDQGASADIFGSHFSGNTTGAYGGAFYVWTDATAKIANSFFVDNSAPNGTIRNYGGNLDLINVVVSGNEQGLSGSGGGVTTATNVTISRNKRSAVRGDLGAEFIFYNSILTDGSTLLKLSGGATVGGDNNLATVSFGTNFIQYNGGDLFGEDGYSLWGENQAEGAGDPTYNDTALDAAGKNRYYGGTLDLGALEQIITVTGGSMVFNGEYQAPINLDGKADWILYSEDGENWTETPPARNAGTYTFWVKAGTDEGDEEIYEVTGTITPVQLEVSGSTVIPREYDGTTGAEIAVGDVSPLYDDVTITAVGVYDSPEVGEHDVEVTYTVTGENAGNYIAPAPETLRGEITKPPYYSLVVTTLDDVFDPYDDVNSLREAVAYAETFNTPVTVTFEEGLEGTIVLTGGAITVSAAEEIAIDGDGRITVDAGGASRVFEINAGEVLLSTMTITGGYDPRYGGAIYNAGDLTLEYVTIDESYSGKFGGAVYTAVGSNLTVLDSSFVDNTAASHGGAIFVEKGATADIDRSYFSGNSTAAYGAAIYQWTDSTVDVMDTLFLNNSAPNGTIRNHGGNLLMVNVVVSGNDQGLAASGSAKVLGINLTVSNNRRSAVRGDSNAEFTFRNSIVIGGKTLFNLSGGATVGGDVNLSTQAFGTNFVKYDGGDLFADDGWTLTGRNQAMNAGNPAYNDTLLDAVGNNRYYGGGLDLGAVEQIARAVGTSVVYNGEYQAPIEVEGPTTWVEYSEDGETWTDTPPTRDAGTYTMYVKVGTDTPGEEKIYLITGEITPKEATLRFDIGERPYDGTTDVPVSGYAIDGLVPGDDVTVTVNGASYADKNAGTDKPIEIDYELGGADLRNYVITVEDASGTITPRTLTVSFTVADKEYDGTAAAEVTGYTLNGLVAGDDVTVTVNGANFADKNAGTDKPVTIDYTISGADLGNYAVTSTQAYAAITPKHLYAIFRAADKVYDGTADATASLVEYIGLVDGDDVTVDAVGAQFNDKNVGVKTVSVSSYAESGADAANYYIFGSIEGAVISAKQLSISGTTVADKYYDGTTDAEITAGTLSGVIDGETVTVTAAGAFPSADAGEYDVPVSYTLGGADAANYAAPAGE
ncbi:MAG: hypothetical protein IKE69_00025, partial [Thermoguttaceae bacterium]|nr:hypothetical protein [Thermoguttaceae bacterium]